MKAIVTGAASFLGISLCKKLLSEGWDVYALTRRKAEHLDYLSANYASFHLVYGDLNEIVSLLPSVVDVADYFFHLGWAGVGAAGRNNPEIQRVNIEYACCAMQVAHRLGVRCFVTFGSQAEYGMTADLITEETPCRPVTEYGKAKLQVYEKGCRMARETGMKYLHLRIFSVYGEYDHPWTLVSDVLRKMLRHEPVELSACTQQWNFLYVEDAVEQAVRLCRYADENTAFLADVFHVASEDTRPLAAFIDEMVALSSTESPIHKTVATPPLSLNPSVRKTKQAIGYVARYTFAEGIQAILKYMKRTCLLCGGHLYDTPLIALENVPASAQDIPSETQLTQDKGLSLNLYQCRDCGLVQFDTSPVSYYRDVIRAGGTTSTMVKLRQTQYAEFIERFDLKGKKILEVGCGQGEFLSILDVFEVHAVGIEHAPHLVEKAKAKGSEVYEAFAEDENTVLPGAPYDAFVQFNFIEHQPNPNAMIQCVYRNLTEDGVGLVTVPSLEYILQYNGYYELIRDHIAYYSENTLRFLFEKNGFEIVACELVNRDTWAVQVRKRKKLDIGYWKRNFGNLHKEIHTFIDSVRKKGGEVAVWGASHQGFTLIPTLNLTDKIKYIIDSAPFKQGKFAPASHVPIVPPDYFHQVPVQAIMIVAPGYTEEIARIIREKYGKSVVIAALRTDHLEILGK